ncbi:MAG TPA: hypothetical protein VMU30_00885 [Bacteroidota bacterium]|nr:hypothetical protein [Bacteroidota bacterium]
MKKKIKKKIPSHYRRLVHALSEDLDQTAKSPLVRSLKDGKDYVCVYCGQVEQPCKSVVGAMCDNMLRTGTVGKEIEDALNDPLKSGCGICAECGNKISAAQLKKNPTAQICSHCEKKIKRVRHKRVA